MKTKVEFDCGFPVGYGEKEFATPGDAQRFVRELRDQYGNVAFTAQIAGKFVDLFPTDEWGAELPLLAEVAAA